jgi:hypothetical protein
MLGAPEMRADLAAIKAGKFFETSSFYRGANGKALWGQLSGSEREYWSELANPPAASSKTVRDPYGLIDGGRRPGDDYQDNTSKPTQYTGLLLRMLPALRQGWPVNGDVLMEYADRWAGHGALALPDSCAPPTGTYGVDYGSNGRGGCISDKAAPFGRVPGADGANKNGGNRKSDFGEQFWTAFRGCAETCSCSGQACAGTGTMRRDADRGTPGILALKILPAGNYDALGRKGWTMRLENPGENGMMIMGSMP